jgi:AraC-like DNA-binding protein
MVVTGQSAKVIVKLNHKCEVFIMRDYSLQHGRLQKQIQQVLLAALQVQYAGYTIRLLRIDLAYRQPNTQIAPHQHSFYEGIIILSGMAHEVTGACGTLAPGTVQLHAPGVVHGWHTQETGMYRLGIWFTSTPAITVSATPEWCVSPSTLQMIDALLDDNPGMPGWTERANAYLTLLLAPMVAIGQQNIVSDMPTMVTTPDIAEIVESFLRDNLAHPITLSDIANHVCVSIPTLTRYLRAHRGVSVKSLLHTLRMKKAMTLLQQTDQSLWPIAAAVGFADTAYFCRCFKDYTHQTPTEYRRLSRTR